MFLKWQQRHQPTGSIIVSDSESEEEAKEANEPENWVGEVAPTSISKRLRSLFKRRVDAQDADKEEQIQAHEIQAREIQAQEGEHNQNMEKLIKLGSQHRSNGTSTFTTRILS